MVRNVMGGDVPSEFARLAAVEVFKEWFEAFGTMKPKEENVI